MSQRRARGCKVATKSIMTLLRACVPRIADAIHGHRRAKASRALFLQNQLPSHPGTEMLTRRCKGELCDLRPVASSLHMWTMASVTQLAMLSHFLDHYVDTLGLLPSHMTFVLHRGVDEGADDNACRELLQRRGVGNVTAAPRYHTAIKRDLVNEHLRSLPAHDWLLYADVDELFHFPCALSTHLLSLKHVDEKKHVFCGYMVDRLADGCNIPAMDILRPLPTQYPLCVPVRNALNEKLLATANCTHSLPEETRYLCKATTMTHSMWNERKIMLLPVTQRGGHRMQFSSSHTLTPPGERPSAPKIEWRWRVPPLLCHSKLVGGIDHYSFDKAAAVLIKRKHAIYVQAARSSPAEEQAITSDQRVLLNQSRNAASQYDDLINLFDWTSESPRLTKIAWRFFKDAQMCCPKASQYIHRAST
mmetsp:Transcript_69045/g.114765  ORF Transcript_69045/g.114765 Transcript_69045/m.114765 type:complete len:419 (-) Transcript_69045:96-1352(-)